MERARLEPRTSLIETKYKYKFLASRWLPGWMFLKRVKRTILEKSSCIYILFQYLFLSHYYLRFRFILDETYREEGINLFFFCVSDVVDHAILHFLHILLQSQTAPAVGVADCRCSNVYMVRYGMIKKWISFSYELI